MSTPGAAVNIPTFVAELPPSPRSRRQQSQDSRAKYAADTNTAKLNEGLRAASINAPIPSMILQESAEEEQSAVSPAVRVDQHKNVPAATSQLLSRNADLAQNVQGAAVSAGSSEMRPSTAPVLAMPSAVVQVMLQLPGTSYQLPVNIPAETILPALTKYLPKLPSVTNAMTMADNSGSAAKHVPQKMDTALSVSQPPASQLGGMTSGSKGAVSRLSETAATQSKIPRLANSTGTSSDLTTVSRQSYKPSSAASVNESDADDSPVTQQTNNNRNAATRCRQKKKVQVEKMEKKTKELQNQNQQLEIEMRELEQDIVALRSLLDEHSDCFLPSTTVHGNRASDSA